MTEVLQEKADKREVKEKRIDSSLSYPTYGRAGLDPKVEFNTYMINENLCNENSPSKVSKGIDDKSKQHRPKIISPRRQKYET